jgi:nucleoid-associated protein YgaU
MTATSKTRPAKNLPRLSWLLGVTLLAAPAYSQSLGDLARQERERKGDQATHSTHVYDNEDLKRPQILLPEDRERVQASKRKAEPAPAKPATEIASSDVELSSLPLSDIARRYSEVVVTVVAAVVGPVAVPDVAPVRKEDRRQPAPSDASRRTLTVRTRVYPVSSEATPEAAAHLSVAPTLPAPVSMSKPSLSKRSIGKPVIGSPEIANTAKPVRKETAEGSRVQVQRGDTLWGLAKEYVGRGEDWPLLAANNPQVTEPARLPVGTWLRVPEKAANTQPSLPPAQQSSRHVRVERGDSLWKLTEAQFGDGRAWGCVAQANPQLQNASLIFPGEILTIPENCAAGPALQGSLPRKCLGVFVHA